MTFPSSQGGDWARASQVYGTTVSVAPYSMLAPAPPPPVDVVDEVVDVELAEAEPIEVKPIDDTRETITDVSGGVSLGRILIRIWLRIHVRRR